MLGVTSYREALRMLGGFVEQQENVVVPPTDGPGSVEDAQILEGLPRSLAIEEQPEEARVVVQVNGEEHILDLPALEALVLEGPSHRGKMTRRDGLLTDVLRAVGQAFDEMQASGVRISLSPAGVEAVLGYSAHGHDQHLTYTADDLIALERAAASRRRGGPPQRVLILHDHGQFTGVLRGVLISEFSVQDLGLVYSQSVTQARNPAEIILLHFTGTEPLQTLLEHIRVLKEAPGTQAIPVVVLAAASALTDPSMIFQAGADDLVMEPYAPALLRARLRTWFLRGTAVAHAVQNASMNGR